MRYVSYRIYIMRYISYCDTCIAIRDMCLPIHSLTHRVSLPSANDWKLKLQWAPAFQNWTKEHWKNIDWSDESWFLEGHSDGRVNICHKQHESMSRPACINSSGCCWWCYGVWDIFLPHFGPLGTNYASLKPHSFPESLLTTSIPLWPQWYDVAW